MGQKPTKGSTVLVKYQSDVERHTRPEGWDEENPAQVVRVDEAAGTVTVVATVVSGPHVAFLQSRQQVLTLALKEGATRRLVPEDARTVGYVWRWPDSPVLTTSISMHLPEGHTPESFARELAAKDDAGMRHAFAAFSE